MADEIDFANSVMENEISRALERIRQQAGQPMMGAKFCMECGDDMPEGRQQMGFKLCVPCAEEAERRKALFAD